MITKQQVIEITEQIPDKEFNAQRVMEEILLLEKIEQGLDDIKNGRAISDEELDKEIEKW